MAKRHARLAAKTIASFDAHTLDDMGPTMSHGSLKSAGATYMSDVTTRPARERHGIRPVVMRMVNDIGILVVSRTGGNAIWVGPCCVMMD